MITSVQFRQFESLFGYYNERLFGGELKDCMLNMNRSRRGSRRAGAFRSDNWRKAEEGNEGIHEISLNPNFLNCPEKEWHSTLVHEMAHLWQRDFGKPSRNGYHNRQWGAKMEEMGLIPSSTGEPGGRRTGQTMSHYINENGLFIKTFNNLSEKKIKHEPVDGEKPVPFAVEKTGGTAASKIKYTCPCGKNGLSIICADCGQSFKAALPSVGGIQRTDTKMRPTK